ncbi:MAG TPA: cytochrome c oxidase subunit 4 [Mycobacteriales bacterium]
MGKAEIYYYAFIGIFFAIADAVYWPMSHEWAGTVCMALGALMGLLVAFYLAVTHRRLGERPEDHGDALIEDGAGDLGHFSPYSVWPIGLAFFAVMFLIGFIFGLWITFISVAGVLITGCGLLFEHYRGWHLTTEEQTGVDPVGMDGGHG